VAILPTIDLPTDCLLMGDLNAHHTWWQGPLPPAATTSLASHTIANWLTENNFHLRNIIATPTHHTRNGGQPSTIDLCLSRGKTIQLVIALVIDHDTTSDHSSLTASLSLPSNAAPQKAQHCWCKADWGSFASHIEAARMDLSNLQGTEDTLCVVTNITHLIHEATNPAIPRKDPQKQEAPWWNQNLTLAKRAVKRAERRARREPNDTNQKDRQYKQHNWSKMVRNAKTAYQIQQLQAASSKNIWKTIYHHNTHHKPIPPLNGQTTFKDKCDVLRNALFPSVNTNPRTRLPPDLLTSTKDIRHHTRPVTLQETHLAITHLKYGTSVGPDDISYSTLRHFNAAAPHLLPQLFTAYLTWGIHPPEWKTANCVVIPKPGKKTYPDPKSYHPISLQSCFGKLLESIVAKRLSQAALTSGAIHPSQMGAQAENSTIDTLLSTITPIARAISQKKAANRTPLRSAVLTHDIEDAFNQVHPATLWEVMQQRRMPQYLTEWVTAFNTDRKIAFSFDEQSEQPQPYKFGLPQGSPVSPALFLIYSNAMLEKSHQPHDAIDTFYVDNVCMVQMSTMIARANTLLEERTEEHLS